MAAQGHDCIEELHNAGFRATPARLSILRVVERAKNPLAARDIARKVPDINEVTVYRTLESFTEAALLRAGEHNRVMRYSYAARPHHHHMVCEDCGFSESCHSCKLVW